MQDARFDDTKTLANDYKKTMSLLTPKALRGLFWVFGVFDQGSSLNLLQFL